MARIVVTGGGGFLGQRLIGALLESDRLVINGDHVSIGSLCVIDSRPRESFSDRDLEILELLAGQAMRLIESRRVSSRLAEALRQVKVLAPMVPVCAWCRRIRDDEDYWSTLEEYLHEQAGSLTSHSICPECETKFNDQLDGEPNADRAGAADSGG